METIYDTHGKLFLYMARNTCDFQLKRSKTTKLVLLTIDI